MNTIIFPLEYKNKVGVVIDTYSFIDSGYKTSTQIIGNIIIDKNGNGKMYLNRNSRYMILIKGLSPIYYEKGDSTTWVQKIQYSIPNKPVLHSYSNYDITQAYGYTALRIYWDESDIKTTYSVEIKKDDGDWSAIDSNVLINTYNLKFTTVGLYQIRVRGKNKANQYGNYSDILSINIDTILVTETLGKMNVPEPKDIIIGE